MSCCVWSDWSLDCETEPTILKDLVANDCASLQLAVLWAYVGIILGLCVNIITLVPILHINNGATDNSDEDSKDSKDSKDSNDSKDF